jgi:drug/metabolite transporter (DMT)-like permease
MDSSGKLGHWAILVLLSMIWGTSYILMKKGLQSFSSIQIGSLRIIITAICLSPVAFRHLSKLKRSNLWSLAIIGFFGSGIPAFLFPLAQTRIDSSMAGMLNSLSPVFTLVVGIRFYQRKAIRSQVAGIFLGLLGALGLLYSNSLSFNYYGLFVILATLLYGISSNEVSLVKDMNGLQITSLAFLILSPFAVITLLLTDPRAALATPGWLMNLGFIAALAIFGSALALALFYLLIRETTPVFASIVTYFIPVVATMWGILDGEPFTLPMILSVSLILAGVYLINRPQLLRKIKKLIT